MKLHHATTDSFVFQLNAQEKELFLEMLQLYPLVPAQHHRLTKSPDAHSDENQRLLEESLAEHRAEKKQMVNALLAAPERFQKHARHFLFEVKATEIDFLLQVLNDVRVGSWLALGEPDPGQPPEMTPENFRHAIAMEVCGAFESLLLAALGQSESTDWADEP